jgi:hypothetical protein
MTTQESHSADRPTGSASTNRPATEEAATEAHAPSEVVPSSGEGGETAAVGGQLVSPEAVMDFKTRWEAIQQGFVDDPRSAVSDADSLVSDVLQKLSSSFEQQHRQLEAQWSDGEPDTEELRSAFQRYRDFFDRLLTI